MGGYANRYWALYVNIPRAYVEHLHWERGDMVDVTIMRVGGREVLVVRKVGKVVKEVKER